MNSLRILGITALVVLLSFSFTLAQGPPPAVSSQSGPNTQKQQYFTSLDGEFTIDLSSSITAFEGINPVPNKSNGGSKYTWKDAKGFFVIEYLVLVSPPTDVSTYLGQVADRTVSQLSDKGATIKSRKDITIDAHSGIDLSYSLAGNVFLTRSIFANNKVYVLTSYWPEAENGDSRMKIFDSFRTIDAKAIIAKRLEAVTPKSLPQSPAIKKEKSDAEDEFLNGRVKSVIETEEYLDGTGSVGGIKSSGDKYFDEKGNLVKQIFYDYRGNPDSIIVYGFIDGKRVSNSGEFLDYEYNPPPMMLSEPVANTAKAEVKPGDLRYGQSFEYKYDDLRRLIEKKEFNNKGELTRKEIYTYDGTNVIELATGKDNKLNFKILRVYDDKFNLINQTYFSTSKEYPDDEKYTYQYLDFDSNGNWIKREERVKTAQYGGGTKDLHSYQYRTISYY